MDPQVEEPLPPDSTNPEHKHKRKHKHKHKHHKEKKSKRDRHAHAENGLASLASEDPASLSQVVAPAGFEDGELPGPPIVEQNPDANIPDLQSVHQHSPLHEHRAESVLLRHNGKHNHADITSDLAHLAASAAGPDLAMPEHGFAADSNDADDLNVRRNDSREEPNRRKTGHDGSRTNPADQSQHVSRRSHERSRHHSSSRYASDSTRHRSSSRRPAQEGHAQPDRPSRQPDRDTRAERDHHRDSHRSEGAAGRSESRRPADRPDSSAGRQDSRRHSDRADNRQSDRDNRHPSRGHGRDGRDFRGARPTGRHYDMSQDRRSDRHPSRGGDRDSHHEKHHDRGRDRQKRKREDEADKEAEQEFVAKVEAALQNNEVDEDRLIEEQRRRRQKILAKHQQEQQGPAGAPSMSEPSGTTGTSPQRSAHMPTSPTGVQPAEPSHGMPALPLGADPAAPSQGMLRSESAHSMHDTAQTAHVDVLAELPPVEEVAQSAADGAASPSISDDEQYQKLDSASLWQQGQSKAAGDGVPAGTVLAPDAEPEVQQADMDDREVPKQAAEEMQQVAAAVPASSGKAAGLDMFADELDADMFSDAPIVSQAVAPEKKALLDNYDDAEGYYNFQVGEIMDGRYEVFATHGKGVFSSVLRARDKQNPVPGTEVAIKMIRSNETMYKAAQTEKVVLRKLAGADPDGRRHCIKLLRTFEYRSHLCLVFEAMDINLRELTKKYGRGIGLNIAAVSKYAAQMLISLYHLRNCGVLHADVKPDNILVSASRTMVKLADFGSAMFSGDNEITPYLVSRFYRAPEVILGLKYDHALDIWSVGCVIYELFTGAILFPGQTNNQMLKLMMDVKGPFPKKMLKKGVFTDRHFEDDPNMSFALLEEDQVTRRPIRRTIAAPHIKKDFAGLLAGSEGDRKKVAQLADLLERMMALDPDKRITPKDALKHAFIKEAK